MYLRQTRWEVVESVLLAEDKVQWQVFVYKIMNLRVIQKAGNILTI